MAHLDTLLAVRTTPGKGIYLSLTRRCPLSCAHCSTNSMITSEQYRGDHFLKFVETFTDDDRPDWVFLTGGEALIRPSLVGAIAGSAHSVGARICLLSGMFFARSAKIPNPIRKAIAETDLFLASLDVFHEQQVERVAVFRVVRELLDGGQDVAFQITGLHDEDPYLAEVTNDIRRSFDDRVPIAVFTVGAVGRARTWLPEPAAVPHDVAPTPCASACWPVVAFDGTVVACCNQDTVDGPAPPHLRLGHIAVDDWSTIRERCLESPMLRAIRTLGPEYMAARLSEGRIIADGFCSTCFKLSADPELEARLRSPSSRAVLWLMDEKMELLRQRREDGLARRFAAGYAPLTSLGGKTQVIGSQ